jgi:hypothetical protein
MYLATGQPARRARCARRRTLGQDFYGEGTGAEYDTSDPFYWNEIKRALMWGAPPLAPGDVTPTIPEMLNPGSPGSVIPLSNPGGGWKDYLLNAVTGHASDAQIAYNQNACVQAIQNMPGLTAEQRATAIAQCAADQQAYTKIAGGTAQQVLSPANLLAGVLPSSDISTWAWLILGGVAGLIVFTRR